MLITCTNCATSYEVSAASLGPTGRSVRCARCQHTWFAANTEAMADVAQAHRADLAWIAETPPGGGPPQAEAPPDAGFDPNVWPDAAADSAQAQSTQADSAQGASAPPASADAPMPAEPSEATPASEADAPQPFYVNDAPPLAPTELPPMPAAELPAHEDIELVAARRDHRQAAQRRRWQRSVWTSAILGLGVINLMLFGWRADVVRLMPQTASLFAAIGLPVNLRGLVFTNVTTGRETHEGVEVLVVEGDIVNNTTRAVEVPRLRFAVHNPMGHELYSWTALPNRNALRPGELLPFSTRLASPPRDSDRVEVRFFNRRDLVAETP